MNQNSEVIAGGDVFVWGSLRGDVVAGSKGDQRAKIFSLDFRPSSVVIGGVRRANPLRESRAAGATSFIALPEADEPNLVALKQAMNEGWQKCEPLGSGSASLWPELFEAGAALIRATVCADASWPADAVEILPGTGWLASASAADENTGNSSSNSRKMRAMSCAAIPRPVS